MDRLYFVYTHVKYLFHLFFSSSFFLTNKKPKPQVRLCGYAYMLLCMKIEVLYAEAENFFYFLFEK